MNATATWLEAAGTAFAALAAFLAYFATVATSHREKHRIVLDIYERFFSNDRCRQTLEQVELRQNDEKAFWRSKEEIQAGTNVEASLTEFDIDDYLGYFEMLGSLVQKKAVFYDDVDNLFGWYIEKASENHAIQEYIANLRVDPSRGPIEDKSIYAGFENLAKRVVCTAKPDCKQERWYEGPLRNLLGYLIISGVVLGLGVGLIAEKRMLPGFTLAGAGVLAIAACLLALSR